MEPIAHDHWVERATNRCVLIYTVDHRKGRQSITFHDCGVEASETPYDGEPQTMAKGAFVEQFRPRTRADNAA